MAGFAPLGQIQTAQSAGRTYQFARGQDNALWTNDGTGWKQVGGVLTSDPWVQQVPGGWQVYGKGTTGDVYKIAEGPTGWANWSDIGQQGPPGSPWGSTPPGTPTKTPANTPQNAAPTLGQGWWSRSALVPNWTGGVVGTPNAANAATSGQLGQGVPDWSIQNGTLYSRMSNNPTDSTVQNHIMRAAAGYLQRGGLTEQQAYDLATSETLKSINQIGAAPSTYTILPFRQGMVQAYAQQGDNAANWSPELQGYMNQAQTWDGRMWHATGKGDLYTGQSGSTQQPDSASPPGTPGQPGNATGAPQSGAASGGGGGNSFLSDSYLQQNPDAAYNYLLQQNGIDPYAPGMLGNFLKQTILGSGGSGLLPNLLATRGPAGTADYVKNLGSQLLSHDAGAGLQGTINNALSTEAAAAPSQLSGPGIDQNQAINYLAQMAQLRSYFAPTITQNALASQLGVSANQYRDASLGMLNGGPNPGAFLQFLPQAIKDRLFGPGF